MVASVAADPRFDLLAVGLAAGQSDDQKMLYREGRLYVEDVSQAALDEAYTNYSHGSGYRDDCLALALQRIATWRANSEATEVTFEYAGRVWDAGLRSQSRIEPVLKMHNLPQGFFWTDHDNNDVPVTMDELKAIADEMNVAIVTRGFAIHARQREMKEELSAMTAEQLQTFIPGWPSE